MAAVQPAPTVTTSTLACLTAISLTFRLPRAGERKDRVWLRDTRVHRRHVAQTLDTLVLRSVLELVGGIRPLRAGVADELPAGEVAITPVDRVGEHSFVDVLEDHREEDLGFLEARDLPVLEIGKKLRLRRFVELDEPPAVLLARDLVERREPL